MLFRSHDPSASSGQVAEKKLEAVGIIANRNTIPGDISPFKPSGIRIGTPAVTTLGMKGKEMQVIAELIYQTLIPLEAARAHSAPLPLTGLTDGKPSAISKAVRNLAKKFS